MVLSLYKGKNKLNFKIVRDIQTSLSNTYMLQEELCFPLTRESDKIFFLSEFSRKLYSKFFPEKLNDENTFVVNPFLSFFPKIKRNIKNRNEIYNTFKIEYNKLKFSNKCKDCFLELEVIVKYHV